MSDKKQPEHLEKFILDLHDNEHALPNSELDDDLADFTRLLVTQRKENEMAKERVWTTVTASGKSVPNFQRWLVFAAAILSLAFIGGLLLLPDETYQFGQSQDTTPTINENAIAQTDFTMATSTSTVTSTVTPTKTVTTTTTFTWTPSSTATSTSTPPATRLIADTDRPLIVTATVSDPAATATAIILTFEASQGTFQPSATPTPTAVPAEILDAQLPSSVTLNLNRIEFVNQTWNNGGPAALSMLLSYYDVNMSQHEIADYLRPHPEDKNTTFEEIVAYLQQTDISMPLSERFIVGADERVIKRAIGAGYPILIATGYEVDESEGWFAQYMLVVGYDKSGFQVLDPYLSRNNEPLHIPYDEFDGQWQDMNRLLLLVYRQGDDTTIQSIVSGYDNPQEATDRVFGHVIQDLALDPEDSWAWFNLGETLLLMGSDEAAVTAFDKAWEVELPWRALWYRTSIFEAYLLGERFDDILRITNDVLKSTPDVEEMYIYRALAYDAKGMTEEAAEAAQQAYELNPGHPMLDNLQSYYDSTPSND